MAPKLLEELATIPREERRVTAAAAALFFALLMSYYFLRPLRDSYGAADPSLLRNLFLGTLALSLAIQPAFGALVQRFGRSRVLPYSYRTLAAITVGFGVALGTLDGRALQWTKYAFFCWLSVYSIAGVSLFWGLLADILGRERALRLFGFIAVGGTLGQISASFVVGIVDEALPRLGLNATAFAVFAAVLLEACVRLCRAVERAAAAFERGDQNADARETERSETPIGGGVLAGFSHVARSPYLTLACVYVVIYVFGSTLLYEVGSNIASEELPNGSERAAFFARVDLGVGVATLMLQLFAARAVLQKLGPGIGLMAVPAVTAIAFLVLGESPTLMALAVFAVLRRSLEYGVSKPSRDALFTVVPPEDKYKAKLVIDTAVYRGGDAAALWGRYGFAALGATTAGIMYGLAGVSLLGVAVSWDLGRRFRRQREVT